MIAFDVCKGVIQKAKVEKFNKKFAKVIEKLEKNCIVVCDPRNDPKMYKFKKL